MFNSGWYFTIEVDLLCRSRPCPWGTLRLHLPGRQAQACGKPLAVYHYEPIEWMLSVVIHTTDYWEQVLQAVGCHQTQITVYEPLKYLPGVNHQSVWGVQYY